MMRLTCLVAVLLTGATGVAETQPPAPAAPTNVVAAPHAPVHAHKAGAKASPKASDAPAIALQPGSPDAALAAAHAAAEAKVKAAAQAAPSARVADPSHSAALFAARSWFVPPPPPPAAAPAPPPEPTAPPLPYTFVGSYAPQGDAPVFFLARGDRVIDAHIGDRLDGIYQFESADASQLVFNYIPLNIRQSLAGGVQQ